MQYDVFISHSSADLAISEKLYEYLEVNGIKCWIDTKNVTGFYARSIIEGIKQSQIMVVVFSRHSNVSPHVENEVDNAFNERKVIIPFRIEDIEMSDVLLYYLRKSHYVDGYLDPVAAFDELKEQIISNLPEKKQDKELHDALTLIALQKGIPIEKIQRIIDELKPESSEEFDKLLQDFLDNDLDEATADSVELNDATNRYDLLQNGAGEIMIIINGEDSPPENPRIVYDGGDEMMLYINKTRALMLNSLTIEAQKAMLNVENVLVVEVKDDDVLREYNVPVRIVKKLRW
jgi:DNA-binding transcriptional MerR regulator